jgi:hypothetical protein
VLAYQDDMDSAGLLAVDLQDLADEAVNAVRGVHSRILARQAVLVDPLTESGRATFGTGAQVLAPEPTAVAVARSPVVFAPRSPGACGLSTTGR